MVSLTRTGFLGALAILAFACSAEPESDGSSVCGSDGFVNGAVLVLTTNYETSSLDLFHPECPSEIQRNQVIASGDAVLRKVGDQPVIVNRGLESNLMILDSALNVVTQIPLADCGPHDVIEMEPGILAVTCYESSVMQKVFVEQERAEPWLNLNGFVGTDGLPEMDALAIDDKYLYVTLQNLDRANNWEPEAPGTLLVYQRDSLELLQEIALPCNNPFTDLFFRDASTLWVGCAGTWSGDETGTGMVSVNIDDWSTSLLYGSAELMGRPTTVEPTMGDQPLVVSATPSANNSFDVETMQVMILSEEAAEIVYQQPGFSLGAIRRWSSDKLLVAQRTYDDQSGVLLINLDTKQVEARWETGLLPSQFIVSE